MSWEGFVDSARQGRGVLRFARPLWKALRRFYLPLPRWLISGLEFVATSIRMAWWLFLKAFIREPLFRARCERVGARLHLEGAVPQIIGTGRIVIGDDVTIGAPISWDLASPLGTPTELIIGNRVAINWRSLISIARRVEIGDDTLIAGNVQIYDNNSHPVDAERRLRHEPLLPEETAPVVIGKNVWIGVNSIILKGVTIGDNSVIAAGSIVTRSVPPNSLVGGNPARVIRSLDATGAGESGAAALVP